MSNPAEPPVGSTAPWESNADIEAEEEQATFGAPRPSGNHARRLRWLALTAVLAAVTAAVSMGYVNGQRAISHADLTFAVKDAASARITFQVTRPRNTTVVCTVRATNPQFATVGRKDVLIPASATSTLLVTSADIRTTSWAVSVSVSECRAT